MLRRWMAAAGLGIAGIGGCSSVSPHNSIAVRPVGYEYRAGTAYQSFPVGNDTVLSAKEAMEEVGVHSIRQVQGTGAITLEGLTADRRKARVSLTTFDQRVTVSARFGNFGDEALAVALFDRLGQGLNPKASKDPGVVPASGEEAPRRQSRFSKDGVSDEIMLKGQADLGYKDTPVP